MTSAVVTQIRIDVPLAAPVAVSALWESPDAPSDVVVIAHGAGAGMEHPFLAGFATALRSAGLGVMRFTFPYREAGRRLPGSPAHAVATWSAAVERARELAPAARIWACGKSYGGRMASVASAGGMVVDGLVYLGYPLHAPGRPDRLRAEHLPDVVPPQLFVEGSADPFVQPVSQLEDAVAECQDARIFWVAGGGHSFEVKGAKRPPEEVGASLAPAVLSFIREQSAPHLT